MAYDRPRTISDGSNELSVFKGKNFVQLWWTDYVSAVRVRIVPMRHFMRLVEKRQFVTVWPHYLRLIDIALPPVAPDRGLNAGKCHLIADFETLRPHPILLDHIILFCYFGLSITGPSLGPVTLEAPECPRQALSNVLDDAASASVGFRLGFELEFSCHPHDQSGPPAEAHRSSGLRAMESFMLPLLTALSNTLNRVDIEVEQLHCEGGADAYELVTGPKEPMEAVDDLVLTKETARRFCRERGVALTFNPAAPSFNGMHCTISIDGPEEQVAQLEDHFLAGVFEHIDALCAFALVRPESYDRTAVDVCCTGRYAAWGTENRELAFRKRRPGCWEMRIPDAAGQMYLYIAAVILAGLDGIRSKAELSAKDCQSEYPCSYHATMVMTCC